MQMLVAAGFPVAWNALPNRRPWNERGFYEFDWRKGTLAQCEDHAVKVMPFDLYRLTSDHVYRFITILRDVSSVEASMAHTVQWRGSEMTDAHKAHDWQQFTLGYVGNHEHVIVDFRDLFNGKAQDIIGSFMGFDALQIAKMNDCVDPSMRHFKPEADNGKV
jgi:hypothetical protein